MISTRGLGKSFGDESVLEAIDIDVPHGQFVSVLGPSGCGKSTLLRLIAGLECATSGELTIADTTSDGDRIAFVFQEPNLLPWRRVAGNIGLPMQLGRRVKRDELERRIRRNLELVGLEPSDARKYPRQLSGGMKMRVSLARALMSQPQIMLMDEPFAALDDLLRFQLNEDLLALWQDQQWTTVFVTHNIVEAAFLSQRVLVMGQRPGRIVGEIDVPFEYPRGIDLRTSHPFAELTGRISRLLREAT